ncbi:UDP-glycosyltransferase 87A1-like isoform X2 [Macadamia integrifolia]|uniref:UDP-glycosyltransferase 87A1-like isoform X2 n=1 Tax=Macadamia integrifolia TaxID=60698 RepID=UPI001C4F89C9|nr:UDP-glycosyltransferase 87A1-like isoform X2 [Macadamia integrifolia]
MASVEADGSKTTSRTSCHVVAMPYPGRGHINPMMNLCKLLASRSSGGDDEGDIVITFVVTEEWLGFIGSDPKPANLRLRSIPNVIPSEKGRADNFAGFVEAVMTKVEGPFEELLDQLETPPTAMITDNYLTWAVAVGNRRNIPVASLCTNSPSVFSVIYHLDLLVQNGHFPVDLSVPEKGGECISYIPGIPSICLADLPRGFNNPTNQELEPVKKISSSIVKAECLLLNSFYELDTQAIDALRAILPFPVYPIGPSIPHMTLKDATTDSDDDYIKWLDSQSLGSVLYVSLGSFLSVSSAQMDEIAAGLHDSGVPYLWVARQDNSDLQKACGDKGLVIPWCNQLRVLCHSSLGGFWTHCGWNSTLEAVFAGVPILTFPIVWDQIPNSKLIADDLRIGWRMKKEVGRDKIVKREEIARTVQSFMYSNEEESKEMRRRARELQDACRKAIEKGGSSETNLDAFVRDILQHHP